MSKFKLCVSISARSAGDLGPKLREAERTRADLFEVRLDHLNRVEVSSALESVKTYSDRCILTCKPKEEGGLFEADIEERVKLYESLIDSSPAYLDLDLTSVMVHEELTRRARKAGVSTIISWHDVKGTPSAAVLRERVSDTLRLGSMGKVVTTARSFRDNMEVLKLYREFDAERLVAFAMGDVGVLSRILAVFQGSPIAFASLPGEPLAPGQLSVEEFRGFVDVVGDID